MHQGQIEKKLLTLKRSYVPIGNRTLDFFSRILNTLTNFGGTHQYTHVVENLAMHHSKKRPV